jgi:O-antigen/teichoic acid export membrane protein
VSFVGNRDQGARERAAQDPDLFWLNRGWWARAGQTSIGSWGSVLLAFIATVIAARALGPSEYGSVVLAVSVATLVASFLDITLEEAVIFHGQRALTATRLATVRALVRTSLVLDVTVGIAIAAAIVALASPVAELVSGGRLDPNLLRLAALAMLAATADGTTGAMLMLAGRTHLRAWVMAATNLLRLAGVIVAVQVGGGEAVIAAYIVASALGATGQGFLAWRLGWRRWQGGTDTGERVGVRALATFGIHTSVGTSLFSARDLLFPVLLGSLAGPAAVGLFRVAMFPVFLADVASGPLRLLLLPEQARLAAEHRLSDLWRSIRVHTLGAATIVIPAAAVGFFALDWLIPVIYSDKFSSAVDPARILMVGAACHLMFSWWKTLPAALGKPQIRSVAAGVSLVITLALLAVLGNSGSEGAALAFSLAAVITGIPLFFLAQHLLLREAAK